MDISKLSILFYKDFKREYFEIPKNSYSNFSAWNLKQKFGVFPKVSFLKKDPIILIMYKYSRHGNELWLYEDNNKFVFKKLEYLKNGFSYRQPLLLYTEYLKEPTFILYKNIGFGITKKLFLIYQEKNNFIYLGWTDDIKKATVFSYSSKINWSEYHNNLVSYKKKF